MHISHGNSKISKASLDTLFGPPSTSESCWKRIRNQHHFKRHFEVEKGTNLHPRPSRPFFQAPNLNELQVVHTKFFGPGHKFFLNLR